ncbi:hypothetical protein OAT16_03080 [Prolixibacteraceae bacterium]|nr:hypothetical protein [Prolixibacteraceae bacterium]
MRKACVVLLLCLSLWSCERNEDVVNEVSVSPRRITSMDQKSAMEVNLVDVVLDTEVDVYSLREADTNELNKLNNTDLDVGESAIEWSERYMDGKMPFISVQLGSDDLFEYRITIDYLSGIKLLSGTNISGQIAITVRKYTNGIGSIRTIALNDFTVDNICAKGLIIKNLLLDVNSSIRISTDSRLSFSRNKSLLLRRDAKYISTWNQGVDTPFIWKDDVWEITGSDVINTKQDCYERTIIEPIVHKRFCPLALQGLIHVDAIKGVDYSVDLGDGTNEAKYQVTFDAK